VLIFFQYSENNGKIEAVALYTANDGSDGYVLYTGSRGSGVSGANATLQYDSHGSTQSFPANLTPEGVTLFFEGSSNNSYELVVLRQATFADYQGAARNYSGSTAARVPTPTMGTTSRAPSARAMAETLMQAAIAGNFTKAVSLFAPDRRSKLKTWRDVVDDSSRDFCAYARSGSPGQSSDQRCQANQPALTGCQGVQYEVVERVAQQGTFGNATYTFVFANPCAIGFRRAMGEKYQSSQLSVSLNTTTGTWEINSAELDSTS
jgi:hypothetical protein